VAKYVISSKVGRKINLARRKLNMTQLDLALDSHLHPTSIGRIERGEINPTLPTLNKIARALRMKPSELMP
jgi:transcriptional regulator with XRE-family HTH domain